MKLEDQKNPHLLQGESPCVNFWKEQQTHEQLFLKKYNPQK